MTDAAQRAAAEGLIEVAARHAGEGGDLAGVGLLVHAHILPSIEPLLAVLRRAGLAAADTVVIGKPYSTIPAAMAALAGHGIAARSAAYRRPSRHYDAWSEAMLQREVAGAIAARPDLRRWVAVDDGGGVARALVARGLERTVDIRVIQQTRSGWYRPEAALVTPGPDVSRTAAKRHFEAQVIAEAVVRRLLERLPGGGRVLVVGLGAVGARVAEALTARGLDVEGWDIDDAKRAGVASRAELLEALGEADAVVGCVGRSWLAPDQLPALAGRSVTLASASSRAVEFDTLLHALASRRWFGAVSGAEPFEACRILNGGFPVNFDRRREAEGFVDMALTRALLAYAVLVAAMRDTPPAAIPPQVQKDLVCRWLALTGREALAARDGLNAADAPLEWWTRETK